MNRVSGFQKLVLGMILIALVYALIVGCARMLGDVLESL